MGNFLPGPVAVTSINTNDNVITVTTSDGKTFSTTIPAGPAGPPGTAIADVGVSPDGFSIIITRTDGKSFMFRLPPGKPGVGISTIAQTFDGSSMKITYTDGGETIVKLPQGPQGLPGIGIKSITPGKDGATIIVTLTDNSTSTLTLPPGTQSDNISNITIDASGNLVLTTVYGKTFTTKMPSTYNPANVFDFILGSADQTTRGDTGPSRAMVKESNKVLTINYGNDFSGGTRINSDMQVTGNAWIDGDLKARKNIYVDGSVIQTGGPAKSLRIASNMNKCLDNNAGILANGNKLQNWDCNNGTAQQWIYGTDGTIRPIADRSYCVDVPGGNFANYQKLQLYKCNDGNAQKFTYNATTQQLKSQNNMCIDNGGNTDNGTAFHLIDCSGDNQNQKFQFF